VTIIYISVKMLHKWTKYFSFLVWSEEEEEEEEEKMM
jgi:hypothetical protein